MKKNAYQETLDYLYARLPMFQRIGAAAYKKDLTNTLALCAHLGNPQHRFRSIHIGGTNGKGSVSHMMAAFCQSAGLKTGLYTSPHYKDFRERIKIDGRYIRRKEVVDFVAAHREIIEDIQPSFFELTVAMAFDHFARHKVDIAVIEVGLGGRLDSTNVIMPEISVITNISFDHMDMLGDTLPKIAFEKAGIIKPGVPLVVGETHPESAPVFRQTAAERKAPVSFADQAYRAEEIPGEGLLANAYRIRSADKREEFHIRIESGGPFQAKNIITALVTAEQLFFASAAFEQPRQNGESWFSLFRAGMSNLRSLTRFKGRWEWLGESPPVLADSAHNEAGIRTLFAYLKERRAGARHIVCGFASDKDLAAILPLFPKDARYYFAKANVPRGMEAGLLQEKARIFGLQGKAYSSVKNALKAARRAAAPDELVLVTGSVFVIAEVL